MGFQQIGCQVHTDHIASLPHEIQSETDHFMKRYKIPEVVKDMKQKAKKPEELAKVPAEPFYVKCTRHDLDQFNADRMAMFVVREGNFTEYHVRDDFIRRNGNVAE